MDRGSTPAFQNEIVKSQSTPIHLVSVHFDEEIIYMNDSYKTIFFDAQEYKGVGHFIGFSDIEETAEVIVSSMTLSLSGIDKIWIANVLARAYINRKVKVFRAFLDNDTHALVADPVLIFEGSMDSPTISENPDQGESIVAVKVTNAWADFERKTGRHANNEQQQSIFPGDKGFEFASQNISDLVWREHM